MRQKKKEVLSLIVQDIFNINKYQLMSDKVIHGFFAIPDEDVPPGIRNVLSTLVAPVFGPIQFLIRAAIELPLRLIQFGLECLRPLAADGTVKKNGIAYYMAEGMATLFKLPRLFVRAVISPSQSMEHARHSKNVIVKAASFLVSVATITAAYLVATIATGGAVGITGPVIASVVAGLVNGARSFRDDERDSNYCRDTIADGLRGVGTFYKKNHSQSGQEATSSRASLVANARLRPAGATAESGSTNNHSVTRSVPPSYYGSSQPLHMITPMTPLPAQPPVYEQPPIYTQGLFRQQDQQVAVPVDAPPAYTASC